MEMGAWGAPYSSIGAAWGAPYCCPLATGAGASELASDVGRSPDLELVAAGVAADSERYADVAVDSELDAVIAPESEAVVSLVPELESIASALSSLAPPSPTGALNE